MRRFFLTLLLFVSPLLLIGSYIEWKLSGIPNSYTQKRDIIAKAGRDARIVVLGASRELNGISPSEFDCSGVNLANVSESLFFGAEVMKQQLRTARHLRLVIQGLAHFSYEYELGDCVEEWRGYYYHRFLGAHLDGAMARLDARSISLIALYGQRSVLTFAAMGFNVNLAEGIDQRGWSALLGVPSDVSDEAAKGRADFHASLMKPEHVRENLGALEAMFEALEKRGVKVAMAASPVSKAYARMISGEALSRMYETTASLVSRYGLIYRDYTFDPRFDASDFFNCDHLSPDGARKYSRILNEEIVRPVGACAR